MYLSLASKVFAKKRIKKYKLQLFFSLLFLFIFPQEDIFAAGYQLSHDSINALGKGYAGSAAHAENASSLHRNPALMMLLDGQSVSLTGVLYGRTTKVKGITTPYDNEQQSFADLLSTSSSTGVYPIPSMAAYANFEDWAIGFSGSSDFSFILNFPNDYAAADSSYDSAIVTATFSGHVARRITEKLSLGMSADVVVGYADLERASGLLGIEDAALPQIFYDLVPEFIPSSLGLGFLYDPATKLVDFTGYDINFGYGLGLVYELNEAATMGLSYRSSVDMNFEGDYQSPIPSILSNFGTNDEKIDGKMKFELPQGLEASLTYNFDNRLELSTSASWTQWSSLDRLNIYNTTENKKIGSLGFNWEDTWRMSVGGSYLKNQDLVLRGGIAYETAASKSNENDMWWFSAGLTFDPKAMRINIPNLSVDLGLSYAVMKEVKYRSNSIAAQSLNNIPIIGDLFKPERLYYERAASRDLFVLGAQLNYSF